jgi:hypothetical protein
VAVRSVAVSDASPELLLYFLRTNVLSVDSSKSSTFVDVERGGFNISYVDGSGSSGDYFQDTLVISGATLKNFEMGLGLSTTIPYGLVGIAYADSEANVDTGNGTQYPNLVDAMVNQGIIATQAYSLWLDDMGRFCPTFCRIWNTANTEYRGFNGFTSFRRD